MSAVEEYANRNALRVKNECSNENPHAHKIIDVDCEYDNGKFVITHLPCPLPSLFTIRFTAPADYAQSDVIVVKGTELPVRTPGMVDATAGIFMAGAVIHCDIDLEREIAFCWQGGNGGAGALPNISYDEQFAGFYDRDGSKVYVKTVDFGQLPLGAAASGTIKQVAHNIDNVKRIVHANFTWWNSVGAVYCESVTGNGQHTIATVDKSAVFVTVWNVDRREWTGEFTLFYTCTDR